MSPSARDGTVLLRPENFPEGPLRPPGTAENRPPAACFGLPGFLHAPHLLGQHAQPTREQIAKALDVHLCRCTGYVKIVDAVERLACGDDAPPCDDGRVGRPLARWQGAEQVLGERDYVDDMRCDG